MRSNRPSLQYGYGGSTLCLPALVHATQSRGINSYKKASNLPIHTTGKIEVVLFVQSSTLKRSVSYWSTALCASLRMHSHLQWCQPHQINQQRPHAQQATNDLARACVHLESKV